MRAAIAIVIVLVFGVTAGTARALEHVTLAIASVPSVSWANLYMAEDAHFLEQEGIEPEWLTVDGTGPAMQFLLSGKLLVAEANPAWLILARQPGKEDAPVHFFYNYNRTNVWIVAVPVDSPIKTVADLTSAVMGVPFVNAGTIPMAKAIFAQSGVSSTSVKFQPVGSGVPAWIALKNGDIAGLMAVRTWRDRMVTKGFTSRLLALPKQFTEIPSLGFIARDDAMADLAKRKLIVGLSRGISKGTLFCQANPEACVLSFWKHHPEQAPQGGADRKAALESDIEILHQDVEDQLRYADGEPKLFGHYPKEAWTTYIETLAQGGEIKQTDIPLASLYTDALLHDINDFDSAKVVEQAHAWRE